ncbi:MAG: hypothetical protein IJA65_00150 [Acholeplasmatales bacterium]|nr:hypothetical protein [Acholeplasmatales bacterium]
MNKKLVYIIGVAIIFGIIIFSISGDNDSKEAASMDTADDTAYYVEANGNIFVKIAKLCDDGCHYVISMVLGGVESIFSSFL